ncbi:ribokinase [Papilio machaon]|uniref:ribokinase n=1 Tax=Papilio machaon TaxID=76193 RepID=UPI001E664F80|nr:ribokinase [Papilio machaon]XP_045536895.1 ribokinase [Papilio machaon]
MDTGDEKRSNHKIVVIGSSSVDFTTYAPRLPNPGETLHGYKFVTSYGGKGANQCVAAAKLGANTYMISRLGDDKWGVEYKKYLKELGVDVCHVTLTPNVSTGIAQIMVAENGENQIVIVPGANNHLSSIDIKAAGDIIETADIVIGQLETPLESTLEAFKRCKGLKLFNAAPAIKNTEVIFPYCSILCLNETEASLYVGYAVDLTNGSFALKKILESGCEKVIITLGDKGAIYSTKYDSKCIHVCCEKVVPVDTTGAGDAFIGALATYLVTHKDYPLHQIIGAACAVATMSVIREGTQTSYPSRFDAFANEYEYKEL